MKFQVGDRVKFTSLELVSIYPRSEHIPNGPCLATIGTIGKIVALGDVAATLQLDDGWMCHILLQSLSPLDPPDGVRVFQGNGNGISVTRNAFVIYGRTSQPELWEFSHAPQYMGEWNCSISETLNSPAWRELHGEEKSAALAKCQPPEPQIDGRWYVTNGSVTTLHRVFDYSRYEPKGIAKNLCLFPNGWGWGSTSEELILEDKGSRRMTAAEVADLLSKNPIPAELLKPAVPQPPRPVLSRRDEFAKAALQGLIASSRDDLAYAISIADRMIAELDKKEGGK